MAHKSMLVFTRMLKLYVKMMNREVIGYCCKTTIWLDNIIGTIKHFITERSIDDCSNTKFVEQFSGKHWTVIFKVNLYFYIIKISGSFHWKVYAHYKRHYM